MNLRWVAACSGAEAVGMAAAAAAAARRTVCPRPCVWLAVAGGLRRGNRAGPGAATVLGARLGAVRRRAWVIVTVLVAGVGWAAGSAPAALSESSAARRLPPLGLILLGAAGLGLVMGAFWGWPR